MNNIRYYYAKQLVYTGFETLIAYLKRQAQLPVLNGLEDGPFELEILLAFRLVQRPSKVVPETLEGPRIVIGCDAGTRIIEGVLCSIKKNYYRYEYMRQCRICDVHFNIFSLLKNLHLHVYIYNCL